MNLKIVFRISIFDKICAATDIYPSQILKQNVLQHFIFPLLLFSKFIILVQVID